MVGHVFEVVDAVHLFNVLLAGIKQLFQAATLNFKRIFFVLPNTAILDFVKFIKLSFEYHEVTTCLALCVDHGLLKSFESVNYFEEAAEF